MTKNISVTILILDFIEEEQQSLRTMLEDQGYGVTKAKSAGDALIRLKLDEPAQVIICDAELPDQDTKSFIEAAKAARPGIPVILLTEMKGFAAMRLCADVGGDDFLTRPLNEANVASLVGTVMDTIVRQNSSGNIEGAGGDNVDQIAEYKLIEIAGKGATGTVYVAEKEENGEIKQYALKQLNPMPTLDEANKRELLERFLREAEVVTHLSHPNIVNVIDYGLAEDELLPYIVMEYVTGQSLRTYMRGGRSLTFDQKLDVLRKIGLALVTIHSNGISHRDLKPENILLEADLNPKVSDFGFARLPNSELTQTIKILGTPFYMAPEAYTSALVDHRADIFSFGVVAYELIVGIKPFVAGTLGDLRRVIKTVDAPDPSLVCPDLQEPLQKLLLKSLEKDPDARFQDLSEIVSILDKFIK